MVEWLEFFLTGFQLLFFPSEFLSWEQAKEEILRI
jgi:hypothetical protein